MIDTNPKTPEDRLYAIVRQGLCTGCGICQAVAGPDRVQVVRTETGMERPVVTGSLDHATVDRIYDTCPGVRAEGLPDREIRANTRMDPVWGPWQRMVTAWAADPVVRHEGSTGGVLTALSRYLIETGRVDFVVHAAASQVDPTFGRPQVSVTGADVLEGAGSRYGPTPVLLNIDEVLDRNGPFAFVGKPCDIAGLRNLALYDPRVDGLVRYWLTPVCGGYMAPVQMDAFLHQMGIEPRDVTSLRYRGLGCPGPTTIETPKGVTQRHYLDMWGEDDSQWGLPWRCKICPDGIGDAADIAAADSWPGGSPDRETSETDPGVNAVIARTEAGAALLEDAQRDGALIIERDVTPQDFSDWQPHQVRKKQVAAARYRGLQEQGRIVPRCDRLRLDALDADLSPHQAAAQTEGTRARIAQGKADEPVPKPLPGRIS